MKVLTSFDACFSQTIFSLQGALQQMHQTKHCANIWQQANNAEVAYGGKSATTASLAATSHCAATKQT